MVAIVASCNMLRAPRVHGAGLGGEAAAPTVPVRPNTTNADPSASTRFILSPLICGPLEPCQCRVAALPECGSPSRASEQLLSRSPRISWKTGRCGVANAGAVARGWSLGLAKDPSLERKADPRPGGLGLPRVQPDHPRAYPSSSAYGTLGSWFDPCAALPSDPSVAGAGLLLALSQI